MTRKERFHVLEINQEGLGKKMKRTNNIPRKRPRNCTKRKGRRLIEPERNIRLSLPLKKISNNKFTPSKKIYIQN